MWLGNERMPWDQGPPAPRVPPMASQFPGELALRDARDRSTRYAQACVARFMVLQLVERLAAGTVDPAGLPLELEAAAEYIAPLTEKAPAEAERLTRVLDRLRRGEARAVPAALLAAGDAAITCGQPYGAWGLYCSAYELATPTGRSAVALSAASRLAELAERMQRPRLARVWQKRCARLLATCR